MIPRPQLVDLFWLVLLCPLQWHTRSSPVDAKRTVINGKVRTAGWPSNVDTFERLFNATLFADLNEWLTLGLETNTAIRSDGTSNFILIPQAHIALTDCLDVQSGIGLGATNDGYEMSAIIRVIYAP